MKISLLFLIVLFCGSCAEILSLIEAGRIDTTPLVTHRFPLERIEEAYRIFENRLDGVIKVAVTGAASTSFSAR